MKQPHSRPQKKQVGDSARCEAHVSPNEMRAEHRRAVVLRLRRAEGQIRGVLRMIDAGAGCEQIAQQLAAARNALDRAFFEMMACSIESEIVECSGSNARHERVAEILRVLSKYS